MNRILQGDCREVLRTLEPGSIHACVTDPPYGLEFMGKEWDAPWKHGFTDISFRPGMSMPVSSSRNPCCRTCRKHQRGLDRCYCAAPDFDETPTSNNKLYQSWCEAWAREVYRVMKPGAFLAVFGGTRTFHRMACAIEGAGFEIRDTLAWHYGSGFPKSKNITNELLAFRACACATDIPDDDISIVGTGEPSVPDGARVGAESRPMPFAGSTTDQTGRLIFQSGAVSRGRQHSVQNRIKQTERHASPIVLGAADVAGVAESDQISWLVSDIEANPKALRNKVVSDQVVGSTAINATPVSADDLSRKDGPQASLITPPSAPPCGVPIARKSVRVVGAHTDPGAVGSCSSASEIGGNKLPPAGLANEQRHSVEHPTERPRLQCKKCGGVIKSEIPVGLGTALKPAMELICLARKPLSEKTVVANVLQHGTGALNIDACRVATSDKLGGGGEKAETAGKFTNEGWRRPWMDDPEASEAFAAKVRANVAKAESLGRFPANVLHDGSEEVEAAFAAFGEKNSPKPYIRGAGTKTATDLVYGDYAQRNGEINASFGDSGTASRFFYSAKADKDDRAGSKHPTVKPVDLMRWLVRLVTPPGGTILDPFAGSGSTGEAAMLEGFDCIMIERDPQSVADIRHRIKRWSGEDAPLFAGVAE